MFKSASNPQIEELTKSCKERTYRLGDFKTLKLDGVHKNCIWCLAVLTGEKRKWCSPECIWSALAWARPQSGLGLYILATKQNFACATCAFSYSDYLDQAKQKVCNYARYRNLDEYDPRKIDYLMKVFKRTMPRSRRPEIDHIDAIVLGGVALGFGNHQLLCALCHKAKTKKDIQEKFAKNGNPRKGVKFTESHVQALSESRKGFDSENRKKSREKNLYPTIRVPIVAFKLDTKEEREFCSSAEAAYALGLQESNISRVLRGSQNRKQHKGWTFRFK
jgi:HNH endonuclease